MEALITDRTEYHVSLLKKLNAKGWNNMTAAEREAWLSGEAAKGAYNYTDLNRVETAVQELSDIFGLGLTTKTDWGAWDIPTTSHMTRYFGNIQAIRRCYLGGNEVPSAPTMPYVSSATGRPFPPFTYVEANNIEKILQAVYETAGTTPGAILGTMKLGMAVIGKEE